MEIKTITWEEIDKEITSWKAIQVLDGSRIYFLAREDKNGFDFKQVNRVSYTDEKIWQNEDECEILLNGIAYFDGIRHLYFGDERSDNFGYFYYPNLYNIQVALIAIEFLVKEYCREY